MRYRQKQNMTNKKQHYSIRKLSVGAASVLIGTTLFLGAQTQKTQAADLNTPVEASVNNSENTPNNEIKENDENKVNGENEAKNVTTEQTLTGSTTTKGNINSEDSKASLSYNKGDKTFDLTSTITNASDQEEKNIISVTVLPNKNDGKSEFDTHLTGPVEVEGRENATNIINYYVVGDEFKNLDALITTDENGNQRPTEAAIKNSFMDGTFKVKKWKEEDWSKVTAVITTMDSLKANSSVSVKLKAQDPTMEDDVDKTIYMSQSTWDDTVFKKVNITRRISMVTNGGKSLGETTQTTGTGVAIYYTNPVNGELIGKGKISPTLDENDVPTFDGYKFQISGHNMLTSGKGIDQWEDFEYDDSGVPIKIKAVTEINHPEAIKINARTGIGMINDTIQLTYEATTGWTGGLSGHTPMMLFANLLTKKAADSEKVVQHISTIRPGDKDSAKLTIVAYQSGIPETRPELPKFEGGVPGVPLEQPELPYKNIDVPGVPETRPNLPAVPNPNNNVPDIPNPDIPEKQVPQKPTPNEPISRKQTHKHHQPKNENSSVNNTRITGSKVQSQKLDNNVNISENSSNNRMLPQTGEKNTANIILGIFTLGLTGLLGLASIKNKKRN